ncbi:MAG TPA: sensor domain-containing diguanylate cyclase, partial [Burkholderiaceae bacterium]|nr:sensor domain-containing diguanylate cyclase [Burkholderiaceae bacterium]
AREHIPTYACLPLIAQGEALGFLHVCCTGPRSAEERRHFLQTVAENLALGLASVKLREALRHEAIRDPLTGLYNRRFMDESLERVLRVAARAGRPLALAMIDIDHFKRLNDTFGHAAGDAVLKQVAAAISARVRASDLACRFGGEEIIVILPDTALDAAMVVAEALRTAVRGLALTDGARPIDPSTISLGVAAFPQHGATPAALMRAADAALYQAKGRGRDRVVMADFTSAAAQERGEISGEALQTRKQP